MELKCVTFFILTCVVVLLTGQVPGVKSVTTLDQGPGNNRTVFEGQRVSLLCDFNNDNQRNIFWVHVDAYGMRHFISRNGYIYNRGRINTNNYEIVVNRARQTYELVFKGVHQDPDEAWYECGYEYGRIFHFAKLARVYLKVLPREYIFSCQYLHLPPSALEHSKQEVDVTCVWNRDVSGKAEFRQNGVVLTSDLAFDDRIINRIELNSNQENVNLSCSVTFELHGTVVSATQPCSNANRYISERTGVIRVDPFINEVHQGSDAVFTCTAGEHSSVLLKFWNVVNMTQSFLAGGRMLHHQSHITLSNIHEKDEMSLVECRAKLPGNIWVSSFAGIKVNALSATHSPPLHVASSSDGESHRMGTGAAIAISTIFICLGIVVIKLAIVVVRKYKNEEPILSIPHKTIKGYIHI